MTIVRWTGVESLALRDAMNLSVRDFADKLGVQARSVSLWERAGSDARISPACRRFLDTLEQQVDARTRARFEQLRGSTIQPEPNSEDDDVNRRELIRLLATVTAGLPALMATLDGDELDRVAGVAESPGRVDAATIANVEAILRAAMLQDDAVGARAVLDTVIAQRNLVRGFLPECPAVLRPRVLSLYGALTAFAGCLFADGRDLRRAATCYERAREAAHQAENTDLGTYILCHQAQLAHWRHIGRAGVDHAVAAQHWVRECSDGQLVAYTSERAALAYASVGRRVECITALSFAADTLADVVPDSDSLAYFAGEGVHLSIEAECHLALGDYAAAVDVSSRSLDLIDTAVAPRDAAFTLLDLARGYAGLRQIDDAARAVSESAELADRNRSPRLRAAILDARAELAPWASTRAVADLDQQLDARGLVTV